MSIKIMPAGDGAVIAEFGTVIDETINDCVHNLARSLSEQNINGIIELVPTFRSLLIYYDCLILSFEEIKNIINVSFHTLKTTKEKKRRIVKIPCCYGARFGVDLSDLEQLTNLTREEIIAIHSSVDYKIYMLGFLPGFVYLGNMDKRIVAPRLSSPRKKIGKGSVGIGGTQTGIYPIESPGGWRLIGATPFDLYDPLRKDPILLNAGDYIRFIPIDIMDYYDIRQEIIKDRFQLDIIEE